MSKGFLGTKILIRKIMKDFYKTFIKLLKFILLFINSLTRIAILN